MEDVSVRAILIGVSVLIAVATISAVMTYYNAAKETVRQIGSGADIAGMYEKNMEEILLKGTITGTDVKNILNYFYDRADAQINLTNIKVYKNNGADGPAFENITGDGKVDGNYTKVVRFIVANETYKVETSVNSGITTINIRNN